MSVPKGPQGIDLFDGPSWDSDEERAYDRMGTLGLSVWTESVLVLVAVSMFVLSVILSVLFFRTVETSFEHLLRSLARELETMNF